MKRTAPIVLLIILGGMIACSKNATHSPSTGTTTSGKASLSVSLSTVKMGQPLMATLSNAASSAKVTWQVIPSGSAHISTASGSAMVLFPTSGSYQLLAIYSDSSGSGSDTSTAPITVTDSTYTPPSSLDTLPLTGDQIMLTPVRDSNRVLFLEVQTKNSYDCFPTLMYSSMVSADSIGVNFSGVVAGSPSGGCGGVQNQAYSYLIFSQLPDGAYAFTVTLNGVVYRGTLTVTDTNYTFTWNYTSGVTISPLQVGNQ